MEAPQITWRKSSRSADQGECVEIGIWQGRYLVRDSKDPDGPALILNRSGFRYLFARAKTKG
jgi:hypothetical protein